MEVRREHQVGSPRQRERETCRQFERATAERPAAETSGHARDRIDRWIVGAAATTEQTGEATAAPPAESHAATHAALKAGTGIALVSFTRRACRIEEEETVVHDRACRRSEVDRPHPHVAIEIQRDHEAAIHVRSTGRYLERLAH